MSNSTPEWKQFEIICSDIQSQLSPDAIVRHDHVVDGKSGAKRKLDISISQSLGSYPLFIIVDCKKHKRPVGRGDVAKFSEQILDVRATLGVMISDSGFDSGAVAVAQTHNILLRAYRAADETDWNELIGEKAWSYLTNVSVVSEESAVTLSDGQRIILSPTTLLYSAEGTELGTVRRLWFTAWKDPSFPKSIGDVTLDVEILKPIFLHHEKLDHYFEIKALNIRCHLSAKKYPVNIGLASGQVIEEFDSKKPVYRRVISEGFNWENVMKETDGIDVSPDEYLAYLSDESSKSFAIPPDHKFLRLIVTNKD